MARQNVTLRRADERALSYVESLLAEHDLPSRDVRSGPGRFFVGYDGDERVGVGGVEIYGGDGLLRSVVVEPSARGTGFGTALCDALEREARADGVEELYLLTTTAAEFFAGHGYEERARSAAPKSIRETAQFAELCLSTATCLAKSL